MELKPCPFCGGKSDLEIDHFPTYDKVRPDVYEVHCPICGGRGGEGWTKEEATEAWNTRAERTCCVEKKSAPYGWECECGNFFPPSVPPRNYCPWCGAKVVEE